jgi:hypothetical protein
MTRSLTVIVFLIALSSAARSQVQVREEPRHKPVFQNQYLRLLDVWLPPGDTTMFHIHSTPSLFVVLSSTLTTTQIKGGTWKSDRSDAGKTWYRSFINDTLVHRVANIDTVSFHVNDIEILSSFDSLAKKPALSLPVLIDTDRAIAYQLKAASLNDKVISGRGPFVAELISGNAAFHDDNNKSTTPMLAGKYMYIAPGSSFHFSAQGEMNMILLEIR